VIQEVISEEKLAFTSLSPKNVIVIDLWRDYPGYDIKYREEMHYC